MEEEVIIKDQPEQQPDQPSGGSKFSAKLKEWCRKRIVALKIKPQIIPLILMVITTVYFMLILFSVSKAVQLAATDPHTAATGICTFITTLLSLLYLVSFLNSFPRRKKPNIVFIVIVGAMIAGQLACDLVYYLQIMKIQPLETTGNTFVTKTKQHLSNQGRMHLHPGTTLM